MRVFGAGADNAMSVGTATALVLAIAAVSLAVFGLYLAGLWRVFTKAGYRGGLSLVPLLNLHYLCKIAGRPDWWVWVMFVPIVGLVFHVRLMRGLAEGFGRSRAFTAGLVLLPIVFLPVLGMGKAQYMGEPFYEY